MCSQSECAQQLPSTLAWQLNTACATVLVFVLYSLTNAVRCCQQLPQLLVRPSKSAVQKPLQLRVTAVRPFSALGCKQCFTAAAARLTIHCRICHN
ncbi:hypothetical protein COO60DRAFT_378887 [Scenedesmus sp. NREL 46B-D3]|nr:hypothetical protein COO60DRAFT_378887 [Scenedesmus sp. NREL 46B-D3]